VLKIKTRREKGFATIPLDIDIDAIEMILSSVIAGRVASEFGPALHQHGDY